MKQLFFALLLCCSIFDYCESQAVEDAPCGSIPGECNCNIIFLLDISGSVSNINNEVNDLMTFTKGMIQRYKNLENNPQPNSATNINIGIITFDTNAKVLATLGQPVVVLNAVINLISETNGWTNYIEAFQMQRDMLVAWPHPDQYTDSVILITDGYPTVTQNGQKIRETDFSFSANQTRAQMKRDILAIVDPQKRDPRFKIMTIRVSENTDADFLRESIATSGLHFRGNEQTQEPLDLFFQDYASLNDQEQLQRQMIEQTCSTLRALVPTTTQRPTSTCQIMVMVDMSGSLDRNEVNMINEVLMNLLRHSTFQNKETGIMQFSDVPSLISNLGRHSLSTYQNDLEDKLYSGGWTATADAVNFLRNFVLPGRVRQNNKLVVLLLSDGYPTRTMGGDRVREAEPQTKREPVLAEVEREISLVKSSYNTAVFTAVGIHGKNTPAADMNFLRKLTGQDSRNLKEATGFWENGDRFDIANKAAQIIQSHCFTGGQ